MKKKTFFFVFVFCFSKKNKFSFQKNVGVCLKTFLKIADEQLKFLKRMILVSNIFEEFSFKDKKLEAKV